MNVPLPTALESLGDQMSQHGWNTAWMRKHGEARVEGSRKGGAAVMVTARYTLEKGWATRFYVIGSVDDGWTDWARVRRSDLLHFIATNRLPVEAKPRKVPHSKCRCRKKAMPTQWHALRHLARIQLQRLATRGAVEEQRVYRCRHDARRWHVTSMEDRSSGPWRGAAADL
ncbi:hypothetical protein [Streptomyces marianii]|uniref:Uncharacterized protein n=1 Tax=Streptomyces marianii TaxID=1817406 RepID=A0A5R9DRI6_9ACTN|nr:hypothetical protein [Streptomyces marianii]TLQ39197.1 hypothetical protein FEF34_37995 [Streptomyces marianii]